MCPQGNCDERHDFIQALPEHGLGSTEEAYQLISRGANHRSVGQSMAKTRSQSQQFADSCLTVNDRQITL